MLGRLVRELPIGDFVYEPKWDGFRCLVFADAEIDLRSRNDRPLARYFPELVRALRDLPARGCVVDGEILVPVGGDYEFTTLMARLHPAASRVKFLSEQSPATLIAFDLLATGIRDLRQEPFIARRAALEQLIVPESEGLRVTPATTDLRTAQEWLHRPGRRGVDGVMAKARDLTYRDGERAMLKVKLERTLDCVVAGLRLPADRPMPSSLLLGLYDEQGILHHIGIAGAFPERLRAHLLEVLAPLSVPLAGHPWEHGFLLEGSPVGRLKGAAGRWAPEMTLDWIPVAPSRVVEVSYDHIEERRLRHPARFRRWREDRDPRSCTFAQV